MACEHCQEKNDSTRTCHHMCTPAGLKLSPGIWVSSNLSSPFQGMQTGQLRLRRSCGQAVLPSPAPTACLVAWVRG